MNSTVRVDGSPGLGDRPLGPASSTGVDSEACVGPAGRMPIAEVPARMRSEGNGLLRGLSWRFRHRETRRYPDVDSSVGSAEAEAGFTG